MTHGITSTYKPSTPYGSDTVGEPDLSLYTGSNPHTDAHKAQEEMTPRQHQYSYQHHLHHSLQSSPCFHHHPLLIPHGALQIPKSVQDTMHHSLLLLTLQHPFYGSLPPLAFFYSHVLTSMEQNFDPVAFTKGIITWSCC
jgi:hypothetical protein